MPITALGPLATSLGGAAGATGGASFLGPLFSGLGGLLGGFIDNREFDRLRGQIGDLTQFNPLSFIGPGGFVNSRTGRVTLDPIQQQFADQIGSVGPQLLSGGLFNNTNLQDALGNVDISGALQGANTSLQQQASPLIDRDWETI